MLKGRYRDAGSAPVWRGAVLAAALLVGIGVPGSSAHAAGEQSVAEWTVDYEATWAQTLTQSDGTTRERTALTDLWLDCTPAACIHWLGPDDVLEIPRGTTRAEASRPTTGGVCDSDFEQGGTTLIEVSGASIRVVRDRPLVAGADCGAYMQLEYPAEHSVLTGTWLSGDLCTLHDEPCASAGDPGTAAGDDQWLVSFDGRAQFAQTGPDGPTVPNDYDETVTLVCGVTECVYTNAHPFFPAYRIVLSAQSPSGSASWDESGDLCAGTRQGAGEATATLAETTLTVVTRVAASGWQDCPGGREYGFAQELTVVAEWTDGDPCVWRGEGCAIAQPGGTDAGEAAPRSSGLASGDPAAPSVLSTLVTPAEAGTAPAQLALAALITVILVLLMSFPTSLMNRAVDAGSDRLSAWAKRRRERRTPSHGDAAGGVAGAASAGETRRWTSSWWWAAVGLLAAAVISSFVDPEFGLNPGSARVFVSIAVGFAADIVLGWVLVIWVMKRTLPQATHSFAFQPLSLLIVVGAVVFTRVTGFEPGIVFGLVAGVGFAGITGRAARAGSALTGLGFAFGLAVVAWFAYGSVASLSGTSLAATLFVETLASTVIGGIVGVPLALIPVRGLAGHRVWEWNRRVWAACYAVGLFAFFVVLMPMPFSWRQIGVDLWTWVGMYVAYAAVAVIAWLIATRPWRAEKAEDAPAETTADAGAA